MAPELCRTGEPREYRESFSRLAREKTKFPGIGEGNISLPPGGRLKSSRISRGSPFSRAAARAHHPTRNPGWHSISPLQLWVLKTLLGRRGGCAPR